MPLGGHDDSRASALASGVWCLVEGTVTAGQAVLRSASQWSLARRTTGVASSHLGMSIQEQEAGRGEVEKSLGEMLLRQRQHGDRIGITLECGSMHSPECVGIIAFK